jgi:hypothetical protein
MALGLGNTSQGTAAVSATPAFAIASSANAVSVLVLTYYSSGPNFALTSSITDPAGLTWHLRKRVVLPSAYAGAGSTAGETFITQETWWSTDTAAHNRSVTANVVNSANVGMIQFVQQDISGSLTPTAPWDTNASLPAVQTFSNASTLGAPSVSGTTTQANSMVLATISEETSSAASTLASTGTGYAATINRTDGTSPNQFHMFMENKTQATAGAVSATTTTTKPAFIFTMDALSGTSTGTAAGDTGASLARLSSGLNNSGTGSPATVTYTNTDPCVIVLNIVTQAGSGGFTPITGVTDSAGVTWHRRQSTAFNSTNFSGVGSSVNHLTQEVWWANLTAAHTSAVTISIALSGTANQATGTLMEWVTVTGSLTPSAPWDTNAALPGRATYSNASVDTLPSAPWTVSSSNAMVLSFLHQMGATGTLNVSVPGAGYVDTGAAQTIGTSGTGPDQAAISWIFGQSGSGTTTWSGGGAGGTGTREWILTTDALTSDTTGSSTDTTTGGVTFTGTISTALTKASMSAAALEKFTGTVATHLTKVSQSLVQSQPISGTITTSLRKVSLAATDVEVFIGTITTNLSRINSAGAGASAQEIFVGQITTRLGPVNIAAIGQEDFIGRVVTRLGSADGHIAANVVQAEFIVLGPIEMTLPPFRPLILGAKLGTPGAGNWYSWRYTDS